MRSAKQIRASIKALITSTAKMGDRIHELALECLQHAQKHGDPSLFGELAEGIHQSQRQETLIQWAETFSPVFYNQKTREYQLRKKDHSAYVDWNLKEADNNPYYTLGREKRQQTVTLESLLKLAAGLGKRAQKANEKGTYEGDFDEDMKKIMSVSELAAQLSGQLSSEDVTAGAKAN